MWRIDWAKCQWMLDPAMEKRVHNGGILINKTEFDYYASRSPLLASKIDQVPCGQCIECRLAKSRDWANRCMLEAKQHDDNCFLTLTYDDKHLHFAQHVDVDSGEVDIRPVLFKRDLQLFFKRLRKKMQKYGFDNIRYFACGEYGDEGGRPHYHVILFNCTFPDLKQAGYSDVCPDKPMFKSKTLDEIWQKGACMVAEVNWETCAYTARYCMKKITGVNKKQRDHVLHSIGLGEDILPPRTTSSRSGRTSSPSQAPARV